MIKRIKKMKQDEVRLIKISREALFEFIYEKFIESQDDYLDVKATDVSDFLEIDFDRGDFLFCAINSEDEKGNFRTLPKEVDLKKVMQHIPDTASSMFQIEPRYRAYTIKELTELSKK